VAQPLIDSHLVDGRMEVGAEIGLKIDQTLTQDATGTLVMLELEAMELPRVQTELSAQYVDHNLLQTDFKNADDHLFLRSACHLINFGILPLTFVDPDDWAKIEPGDVLRLSDAREAIRHGTQLQVINQTKHETCATEHTMTARQVEMILAGSLINLFRARHATYTGPVTGSCRPVLVDRSRSHATEYGNGSLPSPLSTVSCRDPMTPSACNGAADVLIPIDKAE